MSDQAVVNRPTAAFALSLVGGILAMIAAIVFIIMGIAAASLASYTYSYYYSYRYDYTLAYIFGGFGVWMLVCSIIIIVSAAKLNSNLLDHHKWGILILVFSVLMGINILGIIGGALALSYKPMLMSEMAAQYGASPPITRICIQCGRVVNENVRFCPYCGKQLGQQRRS